MKFAILLLAALPTLPPQDEGAAEDPASRVQTLRQDAGDDVDKLWEVYEFCVANGLEEEGTNVLQAVIEYDRQDFRAHELLGYVRQDLEWIAGDEAEKIEEGLYKAGGKWLTLDEANEFHAALDQWWRLPSQQGHFHVYATTERWVAEEALSWMETVFHDLVEFYGRAPERPVSVVLLRNREQYNEFVGGDPSAGKLGVDGTGLSSLYGAFQVEQWYDSNLADFPRSGVAYWDISSWATHAWGKMYARHAAGLAFAEALDPSPKAEARFIRNPTQFNAAEFWAEKKLPGWVRFGGAAYCERFFRDPLAEKEGEDPYQLRAWTINEKIKPGGISPLEQTFALELDINRPEQSQLKIAEAGLLVAFILDGECVPVQNAHRGFKAALRTGEGLEEAITALQETIIEHEAELFAFADIAPRPAEEPVEAAVSETDLPPEGAGGD